MNPTGTGTVEFLVPAAPARPDRNLVVALSG